MLKTGDDNHNGTECQAGRDLAVIQLETHPILDLIVCKGYMILVSGVPRHSRLFVTMCAAEVNNVVTYHFLSTIFRQSVPFCAAMSFLRSPTVSSGLHLTRTR
jgi:hypothetical protein